MQTRFIILWSTIICLAFLAACTTNEQETVKIGVLLPLSGNNAFLGEGLKNSIELATQNLPPTQYRYEIIYEDDRSEPQQAATAAQRLVNTEKVDALISFTSHQGHVVAPIAKENKILHVGIAGDPTIADGEYNFLHWTSPAEEAKEWVAEAEKRGYRRIAIIGLHQQGDQAIILALKEELKDSSVELADEELFNAKERDFRTLLLKAEHANPDVYMIQAFSPEAELIMKQMKELGITKPVSSINTFELVKDPSVFEGAWYVNGADPAPWFRETYRAAYNSEPTIGAANSYDIINMVVYAYESGGRSGAVEQLREVRNFSGALGTLNMHSSGIVQSHAVVRVIEDGQPRTISE